MTPPPSLQELIDTVQRDAASDDLLELLATASSTAAALEEVSDALLGHFVDRCRRGGRSWSEISAALGVSKQAVHKRFSGPIADRLIAQATSASPSMERFTPRARNVLLAAARVARDLRHDSVGTEHLLLGLYAEPHGIAARALSAMNASHGSVEAAVLAAHPRGAGDTVGPRGRSTAVAGGGGTAEAGGGPDRPPFSDAAKGALREALAEALERGHNYIGTEHFLLGLYRMPDSLAASVLGGLGAGHTEAKVRIDELLRSISPNPSRSAR